MPCVRVSFMASLSKYQMTVGRRLYGIFNAFNSVSFALVTGNTLVIYAMYLNASSIYIGIISALNFLSFFALPLGKILSRKKPIMRIYATSWVFRNSAVLCFLPIPFFVKSNIPELGLFFMLIGNAGFNFFRGIGTVANNPVISDLAPGKDRGSFLVFISIINNTAALAATFFLAIALRYGHSLVILNAAMIIGIVCGYIGSFILYKMPSTGTPVAAGTSRFSKNFLNAIHDRNFRIFLWAFSIIGIAVGMSRPFIIVYCREVYAQPDSLITFITFFTSLGALCMGLVSRLFIDKIGAKPMYLLFTAFSILSLIPAIVSPHLGVPAVIFLFLSLLSFLSNLGFSGEENAAQTYFFSLIPREAVMDMSIVYFLVSGATGAAGSLLGGLIIDAFKETGLSITNSYRVFFSIQVILIGVSFYFQLLLKAMGSYRLREALPLFFSLRDIRGLSLLYKLDRSKSSAKQAALLSELNQTNTSAAASNLIEHLYSPSFQVRQSALLSMESLPHLNAEIIAVLIDELEKGIFTTAYHAARILGLKKVKESVSALEKCLFADDYCLVGEAMIALAHISDEKSQMRMGEILHESDNPFVLVWGIRAMVIYGNVASIPILQNILHVDYKNTLVHQEVVLAFSKIMGIESSFYDAYSEYIKEPALAKNILQDLFDEIASHKHLKTRECPPLIIDFLENFKKSIEFAQNLRIYAKESGGSVSAILISTIVDDTIVQIDSYRFFLSYWALKILENPKLLHR